VKRVLLLVIVASLALSGLLIATAAYADTCQTTSVADAYVSQQQPSTNFGTATTLQTDKRGGKNRQSLVQFNLTCIPAGATGISVKLRVLASSVLSGGPRLGAYGALNTWTETGVNWNNRPGSEGFLSVTSLSQNQWAELDVTSWVTGNGTWSLLLRQDSTGGGAIDSFHSREGLNDPQLVVTYTPSVQSPPTVVTNPVSNVTATGATLNGTVNPNGAATTYHFEYGTTTAYGTNVPVPDGAAGAGTTAVPESAGLTGLVSSTTYHFRLVATNSGGTTLGADQSFTTGAPPSRPLPLLPDGSESAALGWAAGTVGSPTRAQCVAKTNGSGSPVRGPQTAQYRLATANNLKYDLGLPTDPDPATWGNIPWTPGPTPYPVILGVSGSSATNDDMCLLGGQVRANLSEATGDGGVGATPYRADHYADDTLRGSIEVGSLTQLHWSTIDGHFASREMDGYHTLGNGNGAIKRFYGYHLQDNCFGADELVGDVTVYDSLFEGCYSGISEEGVTHRAGSTTYVDGSLIWIRGTPDRKPSQKRPGDFIWCEDSGNPASPGCQRLEATGLGTAGLFEGGPGSTTNLKMYNTDVRLEQMSVWNQDLTMSWPCTPGNEWGNTVNCDYQNVRLLWTSSDPVPTEWQQVNLPAG
jgi:hypothetical protein